MYEDSRQKGKEPAPAFTSVLPGSKQLDATERIVTILDLLRAEQTVTMLGEMAKHYDPFQLLISTILSARSTDEVTYPIAENLFERFPSAAALAAADPRQVEAIIRKIGFYKQKAKYIIETARRIETEYGGEVPADLEKLLQLPGVGRKVAGCVLVYAFGLDAIPVDTHVHRLANRMGLVRSSAPEQTELQLMAITPKHYWKYVNDLFVWHGKTTCKPRKPECWRCVIETWCEFGDKNLNAPAGRQSKGQTGLQ